MKRWYEYVCLDCGYGGLTRDPKGYLQGRYVCPRCGSLRFEVSEREAVPLTEEEEAGPEIE